MYATMWSQVILYIIFAWVGEVVMIVVVDVAVAMTKVVWTKVATAQDVAVGRLGSDAARIVVGRYLGHKLAWCVPEQGRAEEAIGMIDGDSYNLADFAMAAGTLQAVLVVVPLVVAVVAKDNLATVREVKMATARTARAGKIHCGSCALQLSLAALRLLLGSQGGQSKAHKEEASSKPVGCHLDGCEGVCGTGKCCRRWEGKW